MKQVEFEVGRISQSGTGRVVSGGAVVGGSVVGWVSGATVSSGGSAVGETAAQPLSSRTARNKARSFLKAIIPFISNQINHSTAHSRLQQIRRYKP